MIHIQRITPLALLLLIGGCGLQGPKYQPGELCSTAQFSISDQFVGARRGSCQVIAEDKVRVSIRQEDDAVVNKSPWYAFEITTDSNDELTIQISYVDAKHRYVPKFSVDGSNWKTFESSQIKLKRFGRIAEIRITPPAEKFWITAQELLLPPRYAAWLSEKEQTLDISLEEIGQSRRGHPIRMLDTGTHSNDTLFIVGRQHPPEVSGAFAFLAFADRLFDDSELARTFRQEFRIVAIPLLNPDGVIDGHWRHNLGSTDLNRDWGPFTQPETLAVQRLLDRLDTNGANIRVFSDFHSTNRNLFYTQDEEHPTKPPQFVPRWLDASAKRVPDYEFTNEERPVGEQANSKNYMYRRYGIPSVTYEVGDETDRRIVNQSAEVFAEELMHLMLCHKRIGWTESCDQPAASQY